MDKKIGLGQAVQNGGGRDFYGQAVQNGGGKDFHGQAVQNGDGKDFPGQDVQNGGGRDFHGQAVQNGGGRDFHGQAVQNGGGRDFHGQTVQNGGGRDFYTLTPYTTLFEYLKNVTKELGVGQCFNTFDMADVLWKAQLWKRHMPNVHPYYAVKTNSDPLLLRFLLLLGFSFDCAAEAEIRMIMKAGNDPEKIVFANAIKTPEALKYARSVGVTLMTFDSEEELLKIKEFYPTAKLLFRLAPEDVECTFDLSDKFGCDIKDSLTVLKRAKELDLDVIGVCFHVGGLCRNMNTYTSTIRASREVFDIASQLGFNFTILDIGGGFIGERGSEEFFIEVSRTIQSDLEEHFSEIEVEVIAEPGTFFVGSAVKLTTGICGKKKRNTLWKGQKNKSTNAIERYYYINDGIYGSFFGGWNEYGYKLKPLLKASELTRRPVYKSRLFGHTCCCDDLVLKECLLPDMEEGEFLMWENMGAYCRGTCSTFCGAPLPATRYVFVHNNRLDLEWLPNPEEITDFIRETCSLIQSEGCTQEIYEGR